MKHVTIKAFAKINLSLDVLNKRDDDYYNIESVFQAMNLFDIIEIKKIERGFFLTGTLVCDISDNLITKARQEIERYTKKKLSCQIHLIKAMPISAGIGGGSSDAGATLIGLNELFNLGLTKKELIAIALKIGSDVPYFVSGFGRAKVRGRGEIIKKDNSKSSDFYVLARPHKRIATKEVFERYSRTGKLFLEIAQDMCPAIKELIKHFLKTSKEVGMSGSGPTVFAGYSSYTKAKKAMEDYGAMRFDGDFFIVNPEKKPSQLIDF